LTKTIVKLIVPYTFSDEREYSIRLSGRIAIVKIKHVKNSEGIEASKGIRFEGSPKMVPDDPLGAMYISNIEIEFPFSPQDLLVNNPTADEVSVMTDVSMKYLSRLTEVIRFATHRYWIKMISQSDVSIYDIVVEDEQSRQAYSVTIPISYPQGYSLPIQIYEESFKRNFIDTILVKGHRVMLSENLIMDALNQYHSGRFSEAIIIANVSLEAFVEEFLLQKFLAEGKTNEEASDAVDQFVEGKKFLTTMKQAFFESMKDQERKDHPMWIKIMHVRTKRKEVVHPHVKRAEQAEAYEVIAEIIDIRKWIMNLSRQ
jgi:hypothetical protein